MNDKIKGNDEYISLRTKKVSAPKITGIAAYNTGPQKRFLTPTANSAITPKNKRAVTMIVDQWNPSTEAIPTQDSGRVEMTKAPKAAIRPTHRNGIP